MLLKDVWNYATTISGEQSVVICGTLLMHQLFADSWDIRVGFKTCSMNIGVHSSDCALGK